MGRYLQDCPKHTENQVRGDSDTDAVETLGPDAE